MIRRIPFDWNIISTSFESAFCTKAIEVDYLKMSENTDSAGTLLFKARAHFCLRLGSHLNEKKNKKKLETTILSAQGPIKLEKYLVFGPTLTLTFLKFGQCENIDIYIYKNFCLSFNLSN